MAGTEITLTVDDANLRQGLQALQARAGSLRPALLDIGEAWLTRTRRRFETESGPGGVAWVPMAKSTRRRRKQSNPKLLRDSHGLFLSLHYSVSETSLTLGTNKIYAAPQHFGHTYTRFARSQVQPRTSKGKNKGKFAKRGRGKAARITIGQHSQTIPARPFVGIDEGDRAIGAEILLRHLGGERG
ncbi:MAG: phage virion morphogenesis protein [Sneathiellaceae bacterium]